MTQEEKAKAYDDVIKKAESLYKVAEPMSACNVIIETIFPELKESEDERIRKELLEHCKNQAKPYIQTGNKCPQIQSWIAWLEKQGKQRLMNEKSLYKAGYLDGFEDGVRDAIIKEDEQKPAGKVEPKFEVGNTIWHKVHKGSLGGFHIVRIENSRYIGDNNTTIDISVADKDYELVEQKPAWSEEDENLLKLSFENLTELKDRFGAGYGKVGECIDWLTSLKDRVQPKQEWSEEDENMIFNICGMLHSHHNVSSEEYNKYYHWLESLRPQNTWKPSGEQLDALEMVVSERQSIALESLYEDIRKLK